MLDAASKGSVASRVLLRLVAGEQHCGKQHQVRSIIQRQARGFSFASQIGDQNRSVIFLKTLRCTSVSFTS